MLRLGQTREEIKVVCDQWGVPTHVDLLASTTLDLINLATPGFGSPNQEPIPSGIYHCAPQGETTWFDYASLIINTAKTHGYCKACKKITPIPAAQYPTAAQRPLNSRLNTEKLNSALGEILNSWEEDVVLAVGQSLLLNEASNEL
jgi:dTDP-4-dehydrorhamnose reductase